jgi:HD-like signal output (HDOD) protein
MTIGLDDLINNAERLISLPEVCIHINRIVNDPDASASDIGQVIQQDPSLTARLLKIANSPYYGFAAEIGTVSRAVTVLGAREIRNLVFATSALSAFNANPGLERIETMWRHNIYCAIASGLLAEVSDKGQTESIFVAGLLHDIGRMLFLSMLPDEADEAARLTSGHGESGLYLAEREVIGFDHAQAGGELIHRWNLPPSLEACARFHHEPSKADQYPLDVAIVHLADCVAHAAQNDSEIEQQLSGVDPASWDQAGLTLDDLEAVLPKTREQFKGVKSLLS